ncbi:TPA: hypothetical protein ACNTR3_001346 [Escherichia coli]|nr:hypothetical protein ELT1_78 [Escherichia phage ELT1]CAJ1093085.1 Phage protein [Escherichia phage vB_Eco_QOTSP]
MHTVKFSTFDINDEFIANIDYIEEDSRYVGIIYITSKTAQGVVCMAEFDEYFLDYDDMIEWSKRYIKRNLL